MAKPEKYPAMRSRAERQDGSTVAELWDWCHRNGLDPQKVTATAAHLRWESPETDTERASREAFAATVVAGREAWELQEYERLSAKFDRGKDHERGDDHG